MSKASEWAKRKEEADALEVPEFEVEGPISIRVSDDGELEITNHSSRRAPRSLLPQKKALALARWILDTFGEET